MLLQERRRVLLPVDKMVGAGEEKLNVIILTSIVRAILMTIDFFSVESTRPLNRSPDFEHCSAPFA